MAFPPSRDPPPARTVVDELKRMGRERHGGVEPT
jgi:hypothetical protein